MIITITKITRKGRFVFVECADDFQPYVLWLKQNVKIKVNKDYKILYERSSVKDGVLNIDVKYIEEVK